MKGEKKSLRLSFFPCCDLHAPLNFWRYWNLGREVYSLWEPGSTVRARWWELGPVEPFLGGLWALHGQQRSAKQLQAGNFIESVLYALMDSAAWTAYCSPSCLAPTSWGSLSFPWDLHLGAWTRHADSACPHVPACNGDHSLWALTTVYKALAISK